MSSIFLSVYLLCNLLFHTNRRLAFLFLLLLLFSATARAGRYCIAPLRASVKSGASPSIPYRVSASFSGANICPTILRAIFTHAIPALTRWRGKMEAPRRQSRGTLFQARKVRASPVIQYISLSFPSNCIAWVFVLFPFVFLFLRKPTFSDLYSVVTASLRCM